MELKQVLGLERNKEFKQAKGDTKILSEVHTHKGCYVSAEDPTKGGLPPRASFPLLTPTNEDWCSLRILHQGEGNTNYLGCTT
jgi:hypothetical protein